MSTTNDGTPDESQTPQDGDQNLIEVNGEKVTIDELKKGYMLQSDYTKKTQELKAREAELEGKGKDPDPSEENLKQWLDANGYAKKEEVEKVKISIQEEQRLAGLLDANPDLKKFETAIKKIANAEGKAFEDVIEEYGFNSGNKLNKAKERGMVGDKDLSTEKKGVKQLNKKERKEFKESAKSGSFEQSKGF